MSLFEDLKSKLTYLEEPQIAQIYKAYAFASEAHEGQKRDSGEPYLIHPLAVAIILADMHLDQDSIIAAFLHDVVEDTSIGKEKIISAFGTPVAELVDGVTKLSQMEFLSRAEVQSESFRKMVLAMSRDIRVIIIKLADRLHNMRTMGSLAPDRKRRIASETLDIYAPIASRLGMHEICVELEELSFAARYPHRCKILQEAVAKMRLERQQVVDEIEKNIFTALTAHSLQKFTILPREKHLYSIYRRMQRYHFSFKEATNNYSFRILVPENDICYLVLGIVHSLYKPILGKFEDYIAIPKFNGYQSLHTSLFGQEGMPIELQIRTYAMDSMANHGIVTHWFSVNNKDKDEDIGDPQLRAQRWITNLLEMQQSTAGSLEFIDNVKTDLFPDEIYVFTPRGNIVELPKGATVVDFAYTVHIDVGNTCVAAKIDQQFIPLSTVLKSGQTVSIITTPEAKPNPAWLNFVVSGRARSSIHNFLKTQKHSDAVELGKELLEKSLADLGSSLSAISVNTLKSILTEWHMQKIEDLYGDIGLGNRIPIFVAHHLISDGSPSLEDKTKLTQVESVKPLIIKGADGMAVSFAHCCYPIPGDQIVGYLQAGHGLVIHKKDCTTLEKLNCKSEMYLPVLWADDVKGEFISAINVEIANQRGALAALAHAVSAAEANICDVRVQERSSGYSLVVLLVQVKSLSHLERILRHISNIPTVIGVTRAKG